MYDYVKAFHVISVIAWMAGLFYLPRLFVYHAMAKPGSEQSETFKLMERRLLKMIMLPAMLASWLFGIWLVLLQNGLLTAPWFQAKLVLVLAMSALHGLMSSWVVEFATDQNRRTDKFYRIINEVPTILLIVIVLLTIVKPF
jgi:putative membrane protein